MTDQKTSFPPTLSGPLKRLSESLTILAQKSSVSAPRLSSMSSELAETLQGLGALQQTPEYRKGISTFEKEVEALSTFVEKATNGNQQLMALSEIRGYLSDLNEQLEPRQAEPDETPYNPLSFFEYAGDKAPTDADTMIFRRFKVAVTTLRDLVFPPHVPTHGIHINFDGAVQEAGRTTGGEVNKPRHIAANMEGHVTLQAKGASQKAAGDIFNNLNANEKDTATPAAANGSLDETVKDNATLPASGSLDETVKDSVTLPVNGSSDLDANKTAKPYQAAGQTDGDGVDNPDSDNRVNMEPEGGVDATAVYAAQEATGNTLGGSNTDETKKLEPALTIECAAPVAGQTAGKEAGNIAANIKGYVTMSAKGANQKATGHIFNGLNAGEDTATPAAA